MDTKEMREKYPFFDEIWNSYDKFNNSITTVDTTYNTICETLINDGNLHKQENRKLCIQILNNLVSLFKETNVNNRIATLCKNFNNWLFYQINPLIITDDVVNNIFSALSKIPEESANVNKCPYYYYYTKFKEPGNIIKLDYFVDNIYSIKNILINKNTPNYCLCRSYVYECIDIYIKMNKTYCPSESGINKDTCDKLRTFQNAYISYFANEIKISNNITSLISPEKGYLSECQPEEAEEIISGKDSNPVVGGVTGTLAGTCLSLLALYKFSPFGPMLRSRMESWKRNNNLDGEQELLFDGTGNLNTYSDNMEYHIQYQSL
ncbi:PIR protein [Plasmodium ovale]|uniref:PIR protein n=1 Tax=Plasmodium ovale TaxID=36330 RepID=A0A1D3JCA0_PLAOA|nr:PIR protein [Plasmodium ovale]